MGRRINGLAQAASARLSRETQIARRTARDSHRHTRPGKAASDEEREAVGEAQALIATVRRVWRGHSFHRVRRGKGSSRSVADVWRHSRRRIRAGSAGAERHVVAMGQISDICNANPGVVSGGDSACGFANTAMQLAHQKMLPEVLAAVVRAMSAVRSLAAFEQGAVGPSKDCAYEGR